MECCWAVSGGGCWLCLGSVTVSERGEARVLAAGKWGRWRVFDLLLVGKKNGVSGGYLVVEFRFLNVWLLQRLA
uniref:Uncharacterized protein n=1 Tax=Solanum tuberosum TaxID=4113 RepID=M0ZT13_SOLTU